MWYVCMQESTEKAYLNQKCQPEQGCGNHVLCHTTDCHGLYRNKTCRDGKEKGVTKIYSDKSAMKLILKNLAYGKC